MIKKCMLGLIRLYQKFISPLKPACCRFYPTCSFYVMEAISRFGVVRGGLLAFYRLLRCQPFCRGGYDPVPDHFTFRRSLPKQDDARLAASKTRAYRRG